MNEENVIRLCGGRGSSYSLPPDGGGNGGGNWSSTPSELAPKSMREALGKRGKSMPVAKAMDANPRWSREHSEYSENCQRCVVAYEMRRRGYNVTAQPTFQGDKLPQVAHIGKSGESWGRWQGAFKGAKPVSVGASTFQAAQNKILKEMQSYGNGARGVVSVQWRRGGGHVFNVEYSNGRLVYADPQTNQRYDPSNVLTNVKPRSVTLTRTDNLKISGRITEFVWTGRGRRR